MWTALVRTNSGRIVAYTINTSHKERAHTLVTKALNKNEFSECLAVMHHLEFELLKRQPQEILSTV